MMGDTHAKLGVSGAIVASAAMSLPLPSAAIVCVAAARWSSTPDSSEERFGVAHRTTTHWLLSCVALAVVPVAVVVLVLTFAAAVIDHGWHASYLPAYVQHIPAVLHRVDLVAHGHRWHGTVGEFLVGLALIVGVLVALGRVIAMVAHTLADACTISGSPLWGPFDRGTVPVIDCETRRPVLDPKTGEPKLVLDRRTGKPRITTRRRHLVPYWLWVRTSSVDDTSVGFWALGLTVLVVWVQAKGFVLPRPPGMPS